MFYQHPTADLSHLLNVTPINIEPILRLHGLGVDATQASQFEKNYEDRYANALRVSALRLTGSPENHSPKDGYLKMLICHHARLILIPLNKLVEKSFELNSVERNSDLFQVPLHVFEKRLEDADVLHYLQRD